MAELRQLASTHNIDILLLTETKLSGKRKIRFPGYEHTYKLRANKKGGGVSIFVKNTIKHQELQLPSNIQADAVAITLTDTNTLIASFYNPPRGKSHALTQDIAAITRLRNKVIIAGDLNAKHHRWNCGSINSCGNALHDLQTRSNFEVLYPDSPTLFPSNGGAPSTVDIIINKNIKDIGEPAVITELNSDHYPVYFKIHTGDKRLTPETFLDYNKGNWNRLKSFINMNTKIEATILSPADVDAQVRNITEIIQSAVNLSVPRKRINYKTHEMDQETRELISERNRIRKLWQRTGLDQHRITKNQLNEEIRKLIFKAGNDRWAKTIESLNVKDRSVWRMAKQLKSRGNQVIPILDGKHATDQDKADALAKNTSSNVQYQ